MKTRMKWLALFWVVGAFLLALSGVWVREAAAVPVSAMNGLDGWTGSYLADSITPNTPTSITVSSASLYTQGINSGIFLTSISNDISFDATGSLQFDLSLSILPTPDDRGSSYDQTVRDFLNFSFLGSDGSFAFLDSWNTSTLPGVSGTLNFGTITYDISTLRGSSGSLYFDLNDQDDGLYTKAVISKLAFVPAQVAPVPEPSTIVLLAAGVCALGIRMRTRKPETP
ncbi:PEP-CTERM sorting domain-containing protein [Geobacter argillaceus]|uniref:Putative secreted protein with PEP-CTERM sorting signal n=1 Tax=Geobacter argillaceus TaxID=345631 RepID=A0A562WRR1_9BACT|nr:PEP-CTERM sorting domain-containing protein [Geobacter argillaceus]TWJ32801.1 putative secreted protein with PEP-CTERM sorting signal [Geobacter argillaceus]